MGRRSRQIFLLVATLVVFALLYFLRLRIQTAAGGTDPGQSAEATTFAGLPPSGENGDGAGAIPGSASNQAEGLMMAEYLEQIAKRFEGARSLEDRLSLYSELRRRILGSPDPKLAAEAIANFLASGRDAPTGLDFAVGGDGFLDTAPTLRTALLDFVAELDAAIALKLARGIMDARTSADEYAVALRNLAWSPLPGAGIGEEVGKRFAAMLDEGSWLAEPSLGFLEAFDAAVALSNRDAIINLASVSGLEDAAGNPVANGTNEAAALALDRIMLRSPDEFVALFRDDPALLDHRPEQRASLLARLDLRRASHLELFLDYLTKRKHAPGELEYFGSLFPNTAFSYGNRLISGQEPAPSIAKMQETDRAYLAILGELRAAGRLPDTPPVQTLFDRLQGYVNEANASVGVVFETAPALGDPVLPPSGTPRNPATTGAPGRVRSIQ